jgi:anthranilate synthase component 1
MDPQVCFEFPWLVRTGCDFNSICFQALIPYPPLHVIEDLIIKKKVGNCVPVYIEFPSELLTPCMAYLRLAKDSKYSFILESVIAGENIARYSFVGTGE